MKYFNNDRTASTAVGTVNREWAKMVRLAIRIRKHLIYNPAQEQRFIGIYRRLLSDPMDELISQLPKEERKKFLS